MMRVAQRKMAQHERPRRNVASVLPHRLQSLFYGDAGAVALPKKFELLHSNPNVYLVHDFLTSSEITYFDKVCTVHAKAFKSSFTQDEDNKEVISEERTSTHIHLSKAQHANVRSVETRAADLVGLHSQNVEPLQIVSYRNGQKFNVHHDAGTLQDDGSVELVMPRRLVTFFAYLNNLPPGEGHTEFPALGLSVQPVRGSAVVFCNVLPNGLPDPRTIHRANPVSGSLKKFGVNIWLCDCSMQQLAQVKAHCSVGPDAVIDEATSALTMAEYYTKKHLAEHSHDSARATQTGQTGASASRATHNGRWAEKDGMRPPARRRAAMAPAGSGRWAEKQGRAPSPSDYWVDIIGKSSPSRDPPTAAGGTTTGRQGGWAEKRGAAPSPTDYWFEESSCSGRSAGRGDGDDSDQQSDPAGSDRDDEAQEENEEEEEEVSDLYSTGSSWEGPGDSTDASESEESSESEAEGDPGRNSSDHSGSGQSTGFVFRLPRTADALYFTEPGPPPPVSKPRPCDSNVSLDEEVSGRESSDFSLITVPSQAGGTPSAPATTSSTSTSNSAKATLRLSFGGEEVTLSGSKRARSPDFEVDDTLEAVVGVGSALATGLV